MSFRPLLLSYASSKNVEYSVFSVDVEPIAYNNYLTSAANSIVMEYKYMDSSDSVHKYEFIIVCTYTISSVCGSELNSAVLGVTIKGTFIERVGESSVSDILNANYVNRIAEQLREIELNLDDFQRVREINGRDKFFSYPIQHVRESKQHEKMDSIDPKYIKYAGDIIQQLVKRKM
jgi:hypothetical protein